MSAEGFPDTLGGLLAELARRRGRPRGETVAYLRRLGAARRIRVQPDRAGAGADEARRLELERDFDPEVGLDRPGGEAGDAGATRVILSSGRQGAGGRPTRLFSECNGLVLDARTWRVLSAPPGVLDRHPAARPVDAALAAGLYEAFPVDDGTVVTLYSWDSPEEGPVWCLSSANGYDVSAFRWIGPKTFAEIVADLAGRLYPGFVEATGLSLAGGGTRLAFRDLDPAFCYTFGFRHHDFHPLRADPERVWQIQRTDVSGPLPRAAPGGWLPGLPAQEALAPEALWARAGGAPPTLAALAAAGARAVPRAAAAAAGRPDAGLDYGLILRLREGAGGAPPLVLVESPLLRQVRMLAYERPPAKLRRFLTYADRLEYVALRAFLTAPLRAPFLALYPEWEPRFQAYTAFLRSAVDTAACALRLKSMGDACRPPRVATPVDHVVAAVLKDNARERLAGFNPDATAVLAGLFHDPGYAVLYLHALRAASGGAASGGASGRASGGASGGAPGGASGGAASGGASGGAAPGGAGGEPGGADAAP